MRRTVLLSMFAMMLTSSPAFAYIVIGEAGRDAGRLNQIQLFLRHLVEQLALLVQ